MTTAEPFVVYQEATGRIIRSCFGIMAHQQPQTGYAILQGEGNDRDDYVLVGAIAPRPDHGITIDKTEITADGIDIATIAGIPAGSVVRINDEAATVEGSSLELGADHPCRQHVWIVPPFPAREFEVTVVAL